MYVVYGTYPLTATDERFSGFGWNKVSHVMELHRAGYKFLVTPDDYVVHGPHSPSLDLSMYRKSEIYRTCLAKLKANFASELNVKYPN